MSESNFDLLPLQEPNSPAEIMQQMNDDMDALIQREDIDPISFAIEAMRNNIVYAAYKNEVVLHEAMTRLEEYKNAKKQRRAKQRKRVERIQREMK